MSLNGPAQERTPGTGTGSPAPRLASFSTKVALCWGASFAGRQLEINFGVSRRRVPADEAAWWPSAGRPELGEGQRQPRPARIPAPGRAGAVTAEVPPSPETEALPGSRAEGLPGFPRSEQTGARAAPSGNFWDCLNADQRRFFRAKAHHRVFAAGARLMQEGEEADHVAVILSGRTQIRVCEHGVERVVAERGPGQLIGERAALEVNVRSATVVALQTVVALVMRTADFAAFISTNPAVLKIVEQQIYLRLREEPPAACYDHDDPGGRRLAPAPGHGGLGTGNGAGPWPSTAGNLAIGAVPRLPELTGQNCTVIRTDVVRFNADERDGEAQKIIRRETLAMTRFALGPVWDTCRREDRGDGLLVIVPPGVPTAQVIERLVTVLPSRLKRHNRTYSEPCRTQLRIAAEVGPIEDDEPGVCGPSINHVSRLVEAPAFKQAIDDQDALLGLIVSPFVYRAHVCPGGSLLDPADFTEVPVQVKETDASGWMRLTGRNGLSWPRRMSRPSGRRQAG